MTLKHVGAWLALSTLVASAQAHRIDEYLQGTLLSLRTDGVQATMGLIPGVLEARSVIAEIDRDHDGVLSPAEQRAYAGRVLQDLSLAVDGQAVPLKLDAFSFPGPGQMRAGLGEIQIDYSAVLPFAAAKRTLVLANHHRSASSVYLVNLLVPGKQDVQVLSQRRSQDQSRYELEYQQRGPIQSMADGDSPAAGRDAGPLRSLFSLGMHHIAEGTDHLLFLFTLLLIAPLRAAAGRWGAATGLKSSAVRILGIVTAFTIGHSITLGLAALNRIEVAQRAVEVFIAISILVSAIHAYRPLFAGKEAWVAGLFGLIHGLAFAAVLARLGMTHWGRVAGILSFNLGIEAMQLVVVAAVMPPLLLLAATRAYTLLRIGGAAVAAAASLGWIWQRLVGMAMPVDAILDTLTPHTMWIAVIGFAVILTAVRIGRTRRRGRSA